MSEPLRTPLRIPLRARAAADETVTSRRLLTGGTCRECGYPLRGLMVDQACPECGDFVRDETHHPSPHAAWARSVFLGLVLSLIITMHATSSVLVQPFEELGGAAPGLNLPGPKLWAMPLLQRPIGEAPELPGVVGTRTAMLSLLAVWLITAPAAASVTRLHRAQALRLLTRWSSVTLFGLAFGAMLSAQGLWPPQLPPFRLMLVTAVELPAATLLYLYLRELACHVPGRARRLVFDRLAWFVPLTIAGGSIVLGVQWAWGSTHAAGLPDALVVTVAAVYGMLAVVVGVAACAAVASLAWAYFFAAFPLARRWLSAIRLGVRRCRELRDRLTRDRRHALAVACGCVLLLFVMLLGIDGALWSTTRTTVGGNLPFINFPGPKIWASAGIVPMNRRFTWNPLVSQTMLLALNLAALWLLTTGSSSRVARATRWVPVVAIGAALGFMATTIHGAVLGLDVGGPERSRFFAVITVLCELPPTVLLYAMLATLAARFGRRRLAAQFLTIGVTIVVLVLTALAWFYFSKVTPKTRFGVGALTLAAMYGACAIAVATWAVASVGALAGAAFLRFAGSTATTEKETPRGEAGRVFALVSPGVAIIPAPASGRHPGGRPARQGSRSER